MGIISVLCVGRLKVRRPLDHETEQLTLIPDLCDSQKKKKKKKRGSPHAWGLNATPRERAGGSEGGRTTAPLTAQKSICNSALHHSLLHDA